MTRKGKLEALLAKVKAGDVPGKDLVDLCFPNERGKVSGFPLCQIVQWIMDPSDIRGMGAAKALHDAALGDGFNYCIHSDSASVMTWAHTIEGKAFSAANSSPARAWLIAIIKALIAKEGEA